MHEFSLTTRIYQRLTSELLGKPLVGNAFRGTLVEAMIAEALAPEWRWCADGWGSFDFEGPGGIGLEVKQSAARQNWHAPGDKPCPPRFDIAERTGHWDEQNAWVPGRGRAAAIYVFAHHPVTDDTADHREPMQWDFYVVAASRLPSQKSMGTSGVRALADCIGFDQLLTGVSACLAGLPRP